jgi:hypothetical protein
MVSRRAWLAVLSAVSCATSPALAADPPLPPRERVVYESTLGIRLNPIGLEEQLTLAYRRRLYDSASLALRDNHVGVALAPTFSPAVFRGGLVAEVRPATVLSLSAGLFRVGYFGSFASLQSFPDATARFSDDELAARKDAGLSYAAAGTEATMRATLLAKIGPIVVRDDALATYQDIDVQRGDRVYVNPRIDLLAPAEGFTLANDTDVVWFSDFGLVAGVRATVLHALLDASEEGAADGRTTPIARVGPVAAYTFFDRPGALFNKPTIIGMAGFWLAHPYRAGQDVSRAVPTAALAFRCEGELWSAGRAPGR